MLTGCADALVVSDPGSQCGSGRLSRGFALCTGPAADDEERRWPQAHTGRSWELLVFT